MNKLLIAGSLLLMLACSTPQMLLNEQLSTQSTPMPVKGRQGILINQKLAFGPYQTDKVGRGWTRSYKMDLLLLGLEGGREKFDFTIFSGQNGITAFCTDKLKGIQVPVDRLSGGRASEDLLNFTIQTKDLFTATLIDQADQSPWYLLIANRDDFRKKGKYAGMLSHPEHGAISVEPVRKLQDQKTIGMDVIGFEFKENGKVLAAVELLNQGRVWIDQNLENNRKLLLAAASAALLLQNDLEDAVESL
jgi:hypothetical protein